MTRGRWPLTFDYISHTSRIGEDIEDKLSGLLVLHLVVETRSRQASLASLSLGPLLR